MGELVDNNYYKQLNELKKNVFYPFEFHFILQSKGGSSLMIGFLFFRTKEKLLKVCDTSLHNLHDPMWAIDWVHMMCAGTPQGAEKQYLFTYAVLSQW